MEKEFKNGLFIIFVFSLRYSACMKKCIVFLFVVISSQLFSQIGGKSTFSVLDLGFSARSNALGVDFITVKDGDVNLGVMNPSLYNELMNRSLSFNQAIMPSGISYGMLTYAAERKKLGTMAGHLRYIDYGKMDRLNEAGTKMGTFTPSEYILGFGMGKQINPLISVGANLNFIYSQLETYNALGVSVDLAGTYYVKKSNVLLTALVKNAGMQLNGYANKTKATLPTDFQLGFSHKLKHAPFRFSIVAHHLNKWNLTYVDPNLKPTVDALTGDTIPVKYAGFGEKLGNHFIFQVELLLTKSIHIRSAFDYHRRQELKVASDAGAAGFSFGLGLNFKRITIDYGIIVNSKAGFTNSFTLRSDLRTWKK